MHFERDHSVGCNQFPRNARSRDREILDRARSAANRGRHVSARARVLLAERVARDWHNNRGRRYVRTSAFEEDHFSPDNSVLHAMVESLETLAFHGPVHGRRSLVLAAFGR